MAERQRQSGEGGGGRPRRGDNRSPEDREFDQKLIEIARVTRVMAGGKRMRFRACIVIGDHNGRLGYGLGKGSDVTIAITKATTRAKRDLFMIPIMNGTIPHEVRIKYKAARLIIKPAPKGTGVMAGGAVRSALELSGIDNIVAKIYGSKNKINNVRALFKALQDLKNTTIRHNLTVPARMKKELEARPVRRDFRERVAVRAPAAPIEQKKEDVIVEPKPEPKS